VSHAHGWSSGPTSALTEFVVGLSVTEPAGRAWTLKPQFGNLKKAEAGFMTGLGKFQAKWERSASDYTLKFQTPTGTAGVVMLPMQDLNGKSTITINGKALGEEQYTQDRKYVVLQFSGGEYHIKVTQ
jgi:hypothetical protein